MDKGKIPIYNRLTIHDAHQFEVKLEYNLEELQYRDNYKIEAVFIIPRSLGINKATYKKEEFYEDLLNYIRFKTPTYSFKLLLDPHFKASPLNIIGGIRESLAQNPPDGEKLYIEKQCIKELKLLGSMFKARLRDFRFYIMKRIYKEKYRKELLIFRLEEMVSRGISLLNKFRELDQSFSKELPGETLLLKYFRIIDEFISHIFESEMVMIFQNVEKMLVDHPQLRPIRENFEEFIRREMGYREDKKFQSILEDNEISRENYLHLMGRYKKVVNSVLYLDLLRENRDIEYINIVGALAAFIAAAFFSLVMFFLSQQYTADLIFYTFLGTLAYVFKDRLKDLIKMVFYPRLLSRFADHDNRIREEGNRIIGNIREKVFFTDMEKMDPVFLGDLQRTRPLVPIEESTEQILIYQKEIHINTKLIKEIHTRTVNITDIMRFNIRRYLEKMDDPEEPIHFFDIQKDKVSTILGNRVYHIDLFLKFSHFSDKKENIRYERYRIVLCKWGIKRLEYLGSIK